MNTSRALASLAFAAVTLVACGGAESKPPAAPSPATTTSGSGDPAFAAVAATPAAKASAADGPLAAGLKETSAWFAPGMTADGPMWTATLAEKGHAHAELQLKAGKCYVLVGFSAANAVADFDLHLWKKQPPQLVADDDDDDTTPTIGKPPICPDADTDYVAELASDKGHGDVAVQLYSKSK